MLTQTDKVKINLQMKLFIDIFNYKNCINKFKNLKLKEKIEKI